MVVTLFPIQNFVEVDENANSTDGICPVADNEVILASERFGNAKAPGLGGIPNRTLNGN